MPKYTIFNAIAVALSLLVLSTNAFAEVLISDAWVRATKPGQAVGAAYVTLKSKESVSLVYAETDRAGSVEMHSMTMNNGVMKMRSMDALPLPAGKVIKLAPGGLHLMLFDLAAPLNAGEQVTFRLCFKDQRGKVNEQFVTMPVQEPQ